MLWCDKKESAKMDISALTKLEIEIMLSIYEKFFVTIFEFDNRDDLADYLSERINLLDAKLLNLNNN